MLEICRRPTALPDRPHPTLLPPLSPTTLPPHSRLFSNPAGAAGIGILVVSILGGLAFIGIIGISIKKATAKAKDKPKADSTNLAPGAAAQEEKDSFTLEAQAESVEMVQTPAESSSSYFDDLGFGDLTSVLACLGAEDEAQIETDV